MSDYEEIDDIRFPWNDMIDMTCGDGDGRVIGICLSAVFEAIQGLRRDLRVSRADDPRN